jgi:uncharacterized protein (DUF58 family)
MPTPRGWAVLAASLTTLLLGLAIGYRELTALGGVGALAVVLAAGWVALPLRLVVDRRVEPDRVVRGDPCSAVLNLHSASRGTRVVTVADRVCGPAGERRVTVAPMRVRGGIPARSTYDLPTDRRGQLTVGPMWIARRDPLGLCGSRRSLGAEARLLVRPRWHPLRGVPLGVAPSLDGPTDAALHGTIVFHTLREYQAGDDLRHIHWRTSARLGTLMVRQHVDAALPRLALLVDDRTESYLDDAGVVEEAIEVAASVLVAAQRTGLSLLLGLTSWEEATDEPSAGLDLLARAQPRRDVDPVVAMHRLRMAAAGTTLVFVTGPGSDIRPVLADRAAYAELVVVVLGTTVASAPADITLLAVATAADFADTWDRLLS